MARKKIDVRKFRHHMSILKKKGLVTGIDARSVKPSPRFLGMIDRFEAVISGKASAVKLSSKAISKYKKIDYEIASPKGLPRRVIIPHDATEKVHVSGDTVTIKNPAGIQRVQIPVQYHDLEQYLEQIARKHETLNRLKGKREFWGFTMYGHRSHNYFSSIDLMMEELQHYESVMNAIDHNNAEQMNDIYRHLEMIKFPDPTKWVQSSKERQQPRTKIHDKAKYQRAKKKRTRGPEWAKEQYNKANADRQREHRARMTDAEKADYKDAARKRAAKSKKKAKKARRKK